MKSMRLAAGIWLVVAACDAAENVEVLPLPPLQRPSPEARLGLPEVVGAWRFAGWEVARGDSTALERTFPSFGELRIETQRLDSVAGTFLLGGGPARVVGDVRRDGRIALVTLGPDGPGRFVAGEVRSDTLWLEVTSILAQDEWPRDARAAFVQEPVAEPIAWLRGARPGDEPPPVDTMATPRLPAGGLPAVTPPTTAAPPGPGPGARPPAGVADPTRPAAPAPSAPVGGADRPAGGPAPAGPATGGAPPAAGARPQPQPPAGGPAGPGPAGQPSPAAPPAPPPREPEPEPEPAEPEPEPEPALPPLLGDPVLRD